MAENTAIEWAHHTINFWWGCTKISDGCRSCYAEAWSKRYGLKLWGPGSVRKRIKGAIPLALKLNKKAEREGVRYRVFTNSMADWFEDFNGDVVDEKANVIGSGLDCLRHEAFEVIDATPHLDWLMLTKRPENIARMMPTYVRTTPSENWFFDPEEQRRRGLTSAGPHQGTMSVSGVGVVRPNLWLGTSTENQATADERIPHLLSVPAAVRFLSVEPLLGPIDLTRVWLPDRSGYWNALTGVLTVKGITSDGRQEFWAETERPITQPISWVICGGESGPGARPCNVKWIRDIVDQCKAAGVPVFVKQLGAKPYDSEGAKDVKGANRKFTQDEWDDPIGKAAACSVLERVLDAMVIPLRDPKGGDWSEWPEDLRVREFPQPQGGVQC